MSEQPAAPVVPSWDLADRMRKSLRHSGTGVQEMADYLGVARNTVSTWINGRIAPSAQTIRLWALRTGVPFEWLRGEDGPRALKGARFKMPRSWTLGNFRPLGYLLAA
jgi:transcriptional regulator with XRE-family HTH domain